ncbi:DNA gyrase subunit A [Gabonia massiliensis]|uniref:DNA gyrase subunit A n=1 Tax=Gabonia massiliensis TaxID=1686296 RepID=UPI0006D825D4|nr:DNA gyrase subunit A [Gabonia massiliensis]
MDTKNILSLKNKTGVITISDLDIINFWRYFLLHDDLLADDIKNTQDPHKRLFLEKAEEIFIEDEPIEEQEDLESGFEDNDPEFQKAIQELENSAGEWKMPEEEEASFGVPSLLFDEDEDDYDTYFKIYNLKLDHSIFYYMYGQVDKWIIKVQEDLSIITDLIKVSEYIPEIIHVIRNSPANRKAYSNLIQKFNISYNTADTILKTKIYKLVETPSEVYIEESNFLLRVLEYLKELYLFDLK